MPLPETTPTTPLAKDMDEKIAAAAKVLPEIALAQNLEEVLREDAPNETEKE